MVIAGPTGVGKTGLSIDLAHEMGTEIISADSRQIYREMSIGTAVPSPEQLRAVKHHFIRNVSIQDYFNASIFESGVLELLNSLFLKYDKVLLVGGTGLYIDAVRHGIDELPTADIELRRNLQERIRQEGLDSLRKELRLLDPVSYKSIDLKNPKRVLKALEICLITGRPYSDFLSHTKKFRDFSLKLVALDLKRESLYERINRRTEAMMASGWLDEVTSLMKYRQLNALNTVGYKELFAYFDGLMTLDQAVEKIKANTRKYARKQLTWFRKDPDYQWFNPDQKDQILEYILND